MAIPEGMQEVSAQIVKLSVGASLRGVYLGHKIVPLEDDNGEPKPTALHRFRTPGGVEALWGGPALDDPLSAVTVGSDCYVERIQDAPAKRAGWSGAKRYKVAASMRGQSAAVGESDDKVPF